MRKNFLLMASLVLAASGAIAAPTAQHAGDFAADLSMNASSGYLFRGVELSPNDISVGGRVALTHASGLGLSLKTQSGNLDTKFMHSQAGASYAFNPGLGLQAKIGLDKHVLTGFLGASAANFTEVVGSATYGGFTGAVAYAIQGDILRKKTVYTEVGYTQVLGTAGQYRVGADLGYTAYSGEAKALGAKKGVSLAQLRAGLKLTPNVELGVNYQLDVANDILGHKSDSNNKFGVQLSYKY